MSEQGKFKIVEDRTNDAQEGETFTWVAGTTPVDTTNGGARACPKAPWKMSGKLRTVRTDYPGAKLPSEQVLGANDEPFTLEGAWDDRYNFGGYAVREKDRFEAMCRRGNFVRISYQRQKFLCLITEWSFDYRKESKIGYQFTVSVHGREGRSDPLVVPPEMPSPFKSMDKAAVLHDALLSLHKRPPNFLSTLADRVTKDVGQVTVRMGELADTLDTRRGVLSPIGDFKRIATQFRILASSTDAVTDKLIEARADLDLGVKNALSVLTFEAWTRGQRGILNLLKLTARKAASVMDAQVHPKAIRLYQPQKGESIYGISRRFYGTPHAWRLIADRNHLNSLTLTGTETLLIPEHGAG